jgi:hypothetical protein
MLIENQMWLHGWLCSALAEFMVMWRWEKISKCILEWEPENVAGYVLLSNISAAVGNRHLCWNVGTAEKGKRCS